METVNIQSGKDILKMFENEEAQPRQIFGRYIHEGELCIFFGDSNTGKSILANDIAYFTAGGGHEWVDMKSPNIPTLYIDMEMTARQFASRYHNAADYIPDNYSRAEVNTLSCEEEDKTFDFLRREIILAQGKPNPPKFIIIDNITNGFGSIFSAKKMRSLITELKTLKSRFGLTILIIAHCPKRKKDKPIDQNDLGGSKMIMDFVDSAFAIAPTPYDESIKYIKQIKVRTGKKMNDVMLVQITPKPYLSFKFLSYAKEEQCLSYTMSIDLTPLITPEKEIKVLEMLVDNKTSFEIAEACDLPIFAVLQYKMNNDL